MATVHFDIGFTATLMLHPATYLNKVLVASKEGNMQLWNIRTNGAVAIPCTITALTQSPAIDVIGVGFMSGEISVYDIRADERLMKMYMEGGSIKALSFRSDGHQVLVSASSLGHLAIWDLNSGGRLLHLVRGAHDASIASAEWVPGQPILITSGEDNSIKQWLFDSPSAAPRLLKFRAGHHLPPHLIRYYGEDGKQLLTASADRSLRYTSVVRDSRSFELSQGSLTRKASTLSKTLNSLKLPPVISISYSTTRSKDWDDVLTAHIDQPFVRSWSVPNKRVGKHTWNYTESASRKTPTGHVKCVCVTACGNFGIVGSNTGEIHMWNMQSGIKRKSFEIGEYPQAVTDRAEQQPNSKESDRCITGLATDSLNRVVIASTSDGTINFFDFYTTKLVHALVLSTSVSSIWLHQSSGLLAAICDDMVVRVIDIETRRVVRELACGSKGRILDIAFSSDSRWIVATSTDSIIRTFDVPTGRLIDAFRTPSIATSIAFSPTSDFLATAHVDSVGVFLWANRAQFTEVTFRSVSEEELDEVSMPLMRGELEDEDAMIALTMEDTPVDIFSTPPQLDGDLVTLTLLPRSRWQTLLNFEVIQQRNKPKEPPKKPEQAPFFLPTLPGTDHRFAIEQKQPEAADRKTRLSKATAKSGSIFQKKLVKMGKTGKSEEELFDYIKTLSPAAIDLELRSLVTLDHHRQFLHALQRRLLSRRDFEAVQTLQNVFLRLHGDVLMENAELRPELEELLELQKKESDRVLGMLSSSLGQMFLIMPTSTSSPAKSLAAAYPSSVTPASETSRASAPSKSDLQALSPVEVEFLDAVIKRIPSNATSFLAGLKAYNDELHERGLDSQTETIHYGRLLELCKLRGPSWQAKWDGIKTLYGYVTVISSNMPGPRVKAPTHPSTNHLAFPKSTRRPLSRLTTPVRHDDDDVFTLHSHQDQDETRATETTEEGEAEEDEERSSPTEQGVIPTSNLVGGYDRVRQPPSLARLVDIPATRVANPILPPSLTRQSTPRPQSKYADFDRQVPTWEDTSDTTNGMIPSPSTTPPSYGAAINATTNTTARPKNQIHTRSPSPIKLPKSDPLSQGPVQTRERKGSVINEEDAWKKIKMARDEEDADKFREFKLLERCWETWVLGYQWIITTNQQVEEARDNVVLGSALHRWRNRAALLLEREGHATRVADVRRLRVAMAVWTAKLKERRHLMWRNEMRSKMKITRQKREYKIQRDAWAKWRQAYCSRLAEMQFRERSIMWLFFRWKMKVAKLERLEVTAVEFSQRPSCSVIAGAWKQWRRAVSIRHAEHTVMANVGLRVKREVMDVWMKRVHDHRLASGFYDIFVLKHAMRSWKAARDRIRAMERRADKHLARQDDVLVRAVTRVWTARERGRLLERVRMLRLLKHSWSTWNDRMRQLRDLQDYAIAFSVRSNSYVVTSALQNWYQTYTIYRNRHTFAVQHYLARVQYNALLVWRIQLRLKLKLSKHARIVEKFFVQRRTLKAWKLKLEMKKRMERLRALEVGKLQAYMTGKTLRFWKQKAIRRRTFRLAEEHVCGATNTRLVANALSRWTDRVIEIKLRELEALCAFILLLTRNFSFAFNKWKNVCLRHVEDLSLMESHLDIKRAETMRRTFNRWLAAARVRRQKRMLLREKELEFDRQALLVAWDKWREKYINEKLRPIAFQVILQNQRNLLFRAFGIWLAKTRSLPAIRFRVFRLKQKSWQKWRSAMPQALQAKKAREMHTKAVLSQAFEKWHQAYKAKRHLKEIARARYLRLPSTVPGQRTTVSKLTGPLVASRSMFPRRALRADAETEDSDVRHCKPLVYSHTRQSYTSFPSKIV
ncbi:hypothetical protein ID866_6722 [Astraeus odoratus]|nr:hypothetical protein ID866_6722 [Astraeus odoratus]